MKKILMAFVFAAFLGTTAQARIASEEVNAAPVLGTAFTSSTKGVTSTVLVIPEAQAKEVGAVCSGVYLTPAFTEGAFPGTLQAHFVWAADEDDDCVIFIGAEVEES